MLHTWIPERAMFIYAHPDDVDFTAAGTAAVWSDAGCQAVYVILTDGNAGSHEDGMTPEKIADIRRAEQKAAARMAGVETVIFVGENDGLLQPTLELRKELVRLIRQYRPQAVVCGDPRTFFSGDNYINHPDHRAAAVVALDAVFPACEMELLYPDLLEAGFKGHKVNRVYISTREDANCFVDISEVLDRKVEGLRQHVSQLGDWDPRPRLSEWAGEVGEKAGCQYAEQFRLITLLDPEKAA